MTILKVVLLGLVGALLVRIAAKWLADKQKNLP